MYTEFETIEYIEYETIESYLTLFYKKISPKTSLKSQ